MKTHDNPSSRGAARWIGLPAIALCAMLGGLPAAHAQDFNPQATGAERDDAVNWKAATGVRHAYARAPYEFARRPHRRHRAY